MNFGGRPTFNHTREDSALYPCPLCASLMTKEELLKVIENLRQDIEDLRERAWERTQQRERES